MQEDALSYKRVYLSATLEAFPQNSLAPIRASGDYVG